MFIDSREFGLDNQLKAVVKFYNGSDLNEPFDEIRGTLKISRHIQVNSNRLQIDFHGVNFPRAKGFEIYYQYLTPPINCDQNDQHSSSTDEDNQNSLRCHNQVQCFSVSNKCNAIFDCTDGSDEENCDQPPSTRDAKTIEQFMGNKIYTQTCGLPAIQPLIRFGTRIIGGEKVVPGSWPWMVSIRAKITQPVGHLCGATIINRYWLLTAAHCVFYFSNYTKYELHLGRFNSIISLAKPEIVRYIDKLIVYPDYNDNHPEHDIALIRMNAPIPDDDNFIKSICLPEQDEKIRDFSPVFVTGWGNKNSHNEEMFLKQASILLLNDEHCIHVYGNQNYRSTNMLCAGRLEGGHDSCDGDSGGPLVIKSNHGFWKLIGVVSSGSKICGEAFKPGTYTNVAHYRYWIEQTMRREEMQRCC